MVDFPADPVVNVGLKEVDAEVKAEVESGVLVCVAGAAFVAIEF